MIQFGIPISYVLSNYVFSFTKQILKVWADFLSIRDFIENSLIRF